MVTVLLIDDNDELRELLRDGLKATGDQVIEATNGRSGLPKFYESHPDLVITDIVMDESEGIEVLLSIRKSTPQIPVITISGHARYLDASRELGAIATLLKPFAMSKLLSCVEKVIGK